MPFIALVSVALVFGQNAKQKAAPKAAPSAEDQSRITVDVTRVNLLYTVTDKKGRFVSDLTKDDFEIIENKKPQKILEFTAETDLPLRLAILIDTSNSIRDRFRFIQEAATDFITTVMRPGKDKAHGGELRYVGRAGVGSDRRPGCDHQSDPRSAAGRRHGSVRRDFLRLPRQADEGSAARQVPPRDRGAERRRGQPEPVYARAGAGNGAQGGRGDLHHLHQHHAPGNQRRQGPEALRGRDRRHRVLPV